LRKAALLILGVAMALGLTTGTAGAQTCPNEAFRVGAGALLPECRAYEMVSPPDKDGGSVYSSINLATDPSGNAVTLYSSTPFAGAPAAPLVGPYIARRGGGSWTTQSVEAPQQNDSAIFELGAAANSPDLTKTLQVSLRALTPGAIEGGSNLYLQNDLTGERQLIAALESPDLFEIARAARGNFYLGGTANWSTFAFASPFKLTPDATEFGNPGFVLNLYEYRDGKLSLANILPEGTPSPGGALPMVNTVSSDGSRVTFHAGELIGGPVYQRIDGNRTVAVSASQRAENKGEVVTAISATAGTDGKLVLFSSNANLVEGEETQGTETLYGYDATTGQLRDLIPNKPAGGARLSNPGILAISEDARTAYIMSTAALTPGSEEGGGETQNIYVDRGGQIDFVARLEESTPVHTAVSPNGRYFAFDTYTPLGGKADSSPACTGGPGGNQCLDTFVYDLADGTLSCVTCSSTPLGNSAIGGTLGRSLAQSAPPTANPVLNDGTVFVETPNALVSRDNNRLNDVYAWRGGVPELISTGASNQPSTFGTASASGADVFFMTSQPLVPIDRDGSFDVYDAATSGGLASQFPPSEPGPCEGEACRGTGPAPPRPAPTGSRSGGDICAGPAGAVEEARTRARRLSSQARRATKAAKTRGGAKAQRRAKSLRKRAGAAGKRADRLASNLKSCRGGK
jgi:hypothetical protein